jgi:hypothetical protein
LKTNKEYKSKVVHEIETRGQEVIDMVKNATEAMVNIVNDNESKFFFLSGSLVVHL